VSEQLKLIKAIENPVADGVLDAALWVPLEMHLKFNGEKIVIVYHVWVNQKAYEDKKQPIARKALALTLPVSDLVDLSLKVVSKAVFEAGTEVNL
jgi:hypothetical protein